MSKIHEDAGGAWPCDSCAAPAAILHCGACPAFLCACCDGRVHGAGGRAAAVPHGRVWMCEVCEQAPAAVTCKADAAALCGSCDADIHSANPLAGRHDRVPVTPFYEPVESVIRRRSSSSQEEVKPKLTDFFFPEVVPLLDLDYSPPSNTTGGFGLILTAAAATTADSVVPVPGKIYIDDASSGLTSLQSSSLDFDCHPPKNGCYNFTFTNASLNQNTSSPSLDVGVVPNGANISFSDGYCGIEAAAASSASAGAGMDREARVLRYREKRKNRKFEKTIRYASRKAYAERRPRIKGRFAKRTESEMEVDRIYSSADSEFGVVPSC